ncbi:MAG TPA: [FeFe] hydrogenase H-cluster radical SAM maturase HydE [Candidatus Eremiobacteraeota bacterium]|nr:MAG: Biotin synthase [bacterium ADurb.Bin363]HPZ10698.1 [FeFe] hydrogenase H-cluster radical SAM maturase HydE [Candidatus Eremiobacteraeota bacterium]
MIIEKEKFTKSDLLKWMKCEDKKELENLYRRAYEVKLNHTGNKVFLRGLIEFSNICRGNCKYCGIRRDNLLERYIMPEDEIIECALWAYKNKYGSVVLQSGERRDREFINFVDNIVKRIRKVTEDNLRVVLCVGEQDYDTYDRWFKSGSHRYLLRIETTSEKLYRELHPEDSTLRERIACLEDLRKVGYQVGTGVMIGLPGQTEEDLVEDIQFFKDIDVDMIGMGPYLPHKETPLYSISLNSEEEIKKRLTLSLKMIALTRIYLEDVNIAATTALQAANPLGREMGLSCGANVIMPNITPTKYRKNYHLYDNKPCLNEASDECKSCIEKRVKSIGDEIAFDETGDSLHFKRRQK